MSAARVLRTTGILALSALIYFSVAAAAHQGPDSEHSSETNSNRIGPACQDITFLSGSANDQSRAEQMAQLYEKVIGLARMKAEQTLGELDNKPGDSIWLHPSHTDPKTGRWVRDREFASREWWTSGFFAGFLWQLYEVTGDPNWSDHALLYTYDLESQKNNAADHDTGFRIFNSYGHAYRLTGNRDYAQVSAQAARTLSTRFGEEVGAIKSWEPWDPWDWNWPVIIDNLINLELLFWASDHTGNPELREIAERHANTTLAHHLRDDGSHYHIVDFDSQGVPRWKGTVQGYGPNSTWARGQAWGIYGFTMAYRFTENPEYLQAAKKMAAYFLDRLPDDGVPFYDFLDPSIPNTTKDVSASAITASALVELYEHTEDQFYLDRAEDLLLAIGRAPYLSTDCQTSSLLRRGTRTKGDPERGLIYADYYYLEALVRYGRVAGYSLPELTSRFRGRLGQNYPNPFSRSTTIPYSVEEDSEVRLRVYTLTGRLVQELVNRHHQPGNYTAEFRASGLSSGIYLYRLETGREGSAKKLLLVK